MVVLTVPTFALAWWFGCYLVARDPARPALRRAAAGLSAYALAVACWTVAPHAGELPLVDATQVLLCVAALAWSGAVLGLLPEQLPERRVIDRGWLLICGILALMIPALPPAGRLLAWAPLAGALVVIWRFRDVVRPASLPAPLTLAALLYGLGLLGMLPSVDLGTQLLVLVAMGLDLAVLGYLIAASDAVDAAERLGPDLQRSGMSAAVAAVGFGGPATLTMFATRHAPLVTTLQLAMVAAAMTAVGVSGPIRLALDRLAFPDDERLRRERAELLQAADSLPRRPGPTRLDAVTEDDFLRLTRRALDSFGDPGRLLRNPLVELPTVQRRLAARGPAGDQPLARAVELRAVLAESIDRLQPAGSPSLTEEWRYYNALHFSYVVGLRPYRRRAVAGLDRDARRALEWFRRYVPQHQLRQWQAEGARLVAAQLYAEWRGTPARWSGRAATPSHLRPATLPGGDGWKR